MFFRFARVHMALLALTASAIAGNITGTVNNKTTAKPAAGDDVVLLKLAEGMQEAARSKSDAHGKFNLRVPDDGAQHLVRVTHQGVNYFRPAPAGTTSVEVDVYEAAKRVEGVSARADIIRLQADSGQIQVTELFVVENSSSPPRSQMSDGSFEITLPEGAVLEASLAAGPGGMPVNSAPVPTDEKNHYAFIFPLRPGETKFQVSYHAPYSDSFSFHPEIMMPTDDVVVMLPKSMRFNSAASLFASGGEEKGLNIYVAHSVAAGKQLDFSISGTGQIPREAQNDTGEPQTSASSAPDNRPGGGLGRPEDTPDPLHAYRWWILGGLAAVLVVGAIMVMNGRSRVVTPSAVAHGANVAPDRIAAGAPRPQKRDLLLEAMKEELFQLETEHIQGRISETEYQQAKAALDLTIKRSIERSEKGRA